MSCPDCFSGFVHEGDPRGTVTKAYGLDVYVTTPSNGGHPKGIVVVIPDAFGWEFINSRLIADKYADQGQFKVYVPDFMDGHPAPVWMLDSVRKLNEPIGILSKVYYGIQILSVLIPFIIRNYPSKAYKSVKGFFEQLRKEEGEALPVGVTGFCWGGKQVVLLGRGDTIDGKPLIDAGFTAHPSILSIPGDIEKLVRPVSFAIGDKDNAVSVAQAEQIKAIVEAKSGPGKGEVRIYENAGHGFALRADAQVLDSSKSAAESDEQCISWFNAHFKITS